MSKQKKAIPKFKYQARQPDTSSPSRNTSPTAPALNDGFWEDQGNRKQRRIAYKLQKKGK